jgi:hypothetical protein
MKFSFTFWALILVISTTHAQTRKIPVSVADAFRTRYPHAEKISWENEIEKFEVHFILNGYKMSAEFNNDGDWQTSEKKIEFEELPLLVQQSFSKTRYVNWEMESIMEIERNMQPIEYSICVRRSHAGKKYLLFDVNGNWQNVE